MTFQAKLTTKLEKYSIGDTILELKTSIDKDELNNIVKNLLKQSDKLFDKNELENNEFDFLVGGRILRLPVEKHLELYSEELDSKEILSEKLVEVQYLLSLNSPKPLDQYNQDDWVSCVDLNDSYLISGSYDNSIRIYSLRERKMIIAIQDAHQKPVTKVRWIKEPANNSNKHELYFVSCGHDEVIILRRFDIKTSKIEILSKFVGHNRSVNCVDANDNIIVTGSFDKTLRLWTTFSDEEVIDENDPENNSTVISKKKKQKVSSNDKLVTRMTKTAIMTLTGHQESITGIKWLDSCNEYNSVASSSMDRTICIWDVEVGSCKRRLLSAKPILGLDYCNGNNLIVSASCDRHVRVWDARAPDNATAKTAYTSHNAWVSSVAFSKKDSNNFISGGYDNLVKLWDLRSPKACLYDLIGHHDKVLDVNMNQNYVSSASADSTIKLFQL